LFNRDGSVPVKAGDFNRTNEKRELRSGFPITLSAQARTTATDKLAKLPDSYTVAQLLGHRDLRMATRYQHLSPEFLSTAVGRLDAIFGEAKLLPTNAA
jgi:integrase